MAIRILSDSVINRIAAGEVVERPASVIKELVENSIDANANSIEILVENAGRNLITIIDNGDGLTKEELLLCVERHATSKIIEDDITNINFFGFRGEALPSIASVSRMTISSKSRNDQNDYGWSLTINGGIKNNTEPSIISLGTKVEVRDLFYATPARLKFLRSEKTELSYIVDCIKKIALANPEVSFKLISDNKEMLSYKSQKGENAYFLRITEIVDNNLKNNLIEINSSDLICNVSGYVGLPTLNFATGTNQYLFVNKRPINDKLVNTAIRIAYQDVLASGRYPAIFMYLNVDPAFVDVNVHPNKLEVRFRDYNMVKSNIIGAIKNVIGQNSKIVSSHFSEQIENYVTKPSNVTNFSQSKENNYNSNTKPFVSNYPKHHGENYQKAQQLFSPIHEAKSIDTSNFVSPEVIKERYDFMPLGHACSQIHNNYIISQNEDGLVIIDQHAAHERIFYERLKKQIYDKKIDRQRLLIPEIIELPDHILESVLIHKDDLLNLGIAIEKFTGNAVIVNEIPALLQCSDIKKLMEEIFYGFEDHQKLEVLEKQINKILSTYACHHSVRSGKKLNLDEMNSLLRQMEEIDFSGQCNHGRPTYIKLSLKSIEKLFERC